MVDKGKVTQGNEKPSSWVYSEDNGWIDIDDFLKNINKLSDKISNKLEKRNVQNKSDD